MNALKKIGYFLGFLGMGAFFASLFNHSPFWTSTVRDGGTILFSIGWGLLLAVLSYSFGMEREKEKIRKIRFKAAFNHRNAPASSGLLYSRKDDSS